MVEVIVRFGASAYASWVSYHTYVTLKRENRISRLQVGDAETLAWLINTFANNIRAQSSGYKAEVSDSVALAIQYMTHARLSKPEELSEIARTGTTKIHGFLVELGFEEYVKPDPLKPLPKSVDKGKYSINLENFPNVALFVKEGWQSVAFKHDEVNTAFIKGVLDEESSEEGVAMLTGISLLRGRSQMKYMRLLSTGSLTLEMLAKALYRSAVSSKNKNFWKGTVEWFELNGFKNYASEILVKKTLCA